MYKQALREVYSRFKILRREAIAIERKRIDVDQAQDASARGGRAESLDYLEATGELENMTRKFRDRLVEFGRFFGQCRALKAELGEITDQRRKQLDADYWMARLKAMAAKDVIQSGRVGGHTIELAMALPKPMKEELLPLMMQPGGDELLKWWLGYEELLPPYEPVDMRSVVLPTATALERILSHDATAKSLAGYPA